MDQKACEEEREVEDDIDKLPPSPSPMKKMSGDINLHDDASILNFNSNTGENANLADLRVLNCQSQQEAIPRQMIILILASALLPLVCRMGPFFLTTRATVSLVLMMSSRTPQIFPLGPPRETFRNLKPSSIAVTR